MNKEIIDTETEDTIYKGLVALEDVIHQVALDHGWWDMEPDLEKTLTVLREDNLEDLNAVADRLEDKYGRRNTGEALALMHSELSEALEGDRHGNPPSEHIPEFSALEEELADVVIRALDFGKGRGLNVAQAVLAKVEYNHNRPYKHGGKKY